jgi:hypothetical protein
MGGIVRVLLLVVAILGLGNVTCPAHGQTAPGDAAAQAAPTKKERPAKKPKNKPVAAEVALPVPLVLPDPPTPVQQIQQLGITRCVNVMNKMSRETLNRNYDVQSGWNRDAPAQHVFQSVAVLNSPQSTPQDGLTALVATPTPNGSCDGVALQVFPLAGDCASDQKLMEAGGSTTRPLINARIMFDTNGKRLFLVPGFGKTCIAVAVDSIFGALKQ